MQFVLIHSPFLGPSVWAPLRSRLRALGHSVAAPDLRGRLEENNPYEAVARSISAAAGEGAHVVLHSGAGAWAPSIWAEDSDLTRMIFLDALLPHPGLSWFETLPGAMADRLGDAAVAGRLPPWPRWLPAGDFERLVPDDRLRKRIAAEAVGAPLSYATAKAPRVAGWDAATTCHYIQLSEAYDGEASRAAEMGVPVDRIERTHCSMVSAPDVVADLILAAAQRLA